MNALMKRESMRQVNQSMEMDVDGSAPFLQGPTNGPGHEVLDGSDSDEENEESDNNGDATSQSSNEDSNDDDDDHDGDEKTRASKRGKGKNGKQRSPSKEEPCEDRGILKMLIFSKVYRVHRKEKNTLSIFYWTLIVPFCSLNSLDPKDIQEVANTLKQILAFDGKMQNLIGRLEKLEGDDAKELLELSSSTSSKANLFAKRFNISPTYFLIPSSKVSSKARSGS